MLVDGRPVGVVPYRGSLGTGPHRIRVVADGEVLFTREVNVEQGAEPILLRVDGDEPTGEDDDEAASERTGGSTAGVAAGSALGVVGAWAPCSGWWSRRPAAAARTATRSASAPGERELRRGPAVAVGVLGAAMMATGVVLILRSRGSSEPGPEVSARVSPTSAALNVSF